MGILHPIQAVRNLEGRRDRRRCQSAQTNTSARGHSPRRYITKSYPLATPALTVRRRGDYSKRYIAEKRKPPRFTSWGDYKKCNTMNQVTVMKLDLECDKQREAQEDR